MQIYNYFLLATLSAAVSAVKVSFYDGQDVHCLQEPVHEEENFQFDQCVGLPEGQPTFGPMIIWGNEANGTIEGERYIYPGCEDGGVRGIPFMAVTGHCKILQPAESIKINKPFRKFHYYESPDCSGNPKVLEAEMDPKEFQGDQCQINGSIRGIDDVQYPKIGLNSAFCDDKSPRPRVVDLNDGECVPLKRKEFRRDIADTTYHMIY